MLGPRREPGAEPEQVDREVAEWAGTGAAKAAYQLGTEQATTEKAGWAVGHDVGLSADTEHREFVHAVIDGFAAGTAERQELASHLLEAPDPEPEAEPG